MYTISAEILTVILICQFGECIEITKLTYAIIDPFIQALVFLHAVLTSTNLKSCQQHCLSKPPNIMFDNISAYTVCKHTLLSLFI